MIARLAILLALSRRPEHRWRRVAVIVASAVSAGLVLFAVSFLAAIGHQEDRLEARTAYIAEQDSPSDLLLVARGSIFSGEDFVPIIWIAPSSDSSSVLPPGMATLPEPGVAVVSPALARAIERDPDLASRFPHVSELGSAGIMGRNELIAWVRPIDPVDPATASVRISGFGDPSKGQPYENFAVETLPNENEAIVGSLGFVVIPAALLLFLGLAAASSLRSDRIATLKLLGASRDWTTRLILAETLVLAVPPFIVAIAIWAIVDTSIPRFPIIDNQLVAGDMDLSVWTLGLVGAWLIAAVVAMVLLQNGISLLRRKREVSSARAFSLKTVGPILLVIPITVTVIAATNRNLNAFYVGLLATVVLIPIVLPRVIQPIGAAIAQSGPVPSLLAGRRLMASAARIGRPFTVLASVAIVVSVSYGYLQEVNGAATYLVERGDGPSSVSITFRPSTSADIDTLAADLAPNAVFPLDSSLQREPGSDQITSVATVIGGDCAAIAGSLGVQPNPCDPAQPAVIPDLLEQRLMLAGVPLPVIANPELAIDGSTVVRQFVVLSNMPEDELRARVGAATPLDRYVGIQTMSAGTSGVKPPAKAAYVNAGILLAIVIAGLAAYLAIIDRMIATIADRSILTVLGLTLRGLRQVEILAFLIPYVSIVGGGILIGWLNLWAFHRLAGGHPDPRIIIWTGVATVAGAIVGSLAIGRLGIGCDRPDGPQRTRWMT